MNEQSIFLAALDFADPAERSAYLIKACAGNSALLQKVKTLLASHEKSGDFLAMPALRQMSDDPESTQADGSSARDEIDLSYLTPSTKPDLLGTLAHYEILQVLGQGGFGTVLKAFDEKLHRLVAIKVLSRELAATSPPRKRFLREARSVAAIKHENVIAIHSVEEQPIPYFIMEFVDGATLQDKMDESGPIPVSEILHIGKQIASGLVAAHGLGLIHRDIKPANILIENGVVQKVKITDFGLARAADDASMTQSGMIAGTPLYMAPEQAKGAKLDARTDLFSLGSVLYALATGHAPFRASSAFAVLRRVTEDTPRPMQEVISDIPDWLVAIVNKLLEKKPEDRFQSAQELADLLAQCQRELQAGVPITVVKKYGVTRLTPSVPSLKTVQKQKQFPVSGVAAGVLLMFTVMAAGLFFLNKNRNNGTLVVSPSKPDIASSSTIAATSNHSASERVNTQAEAEASSASGNSSATGGIAPNGSPPATLKNSVGMEFVKVPKGTAWLGGVSGQEGNTKVEIEQDFYLGKYEVTQEEWKAVMGLAPSHFSRNGAGADSVKDVSDEDLKKLPVEQVSWEDCQLFIERLNTKEKDTGRVYRLPNESEWEYACRGGPVDRLDSAFGFYFANPTNTLLPAQANFGFPQALKRTTKVGSYDPNVLGLHDMHGNVWEWCDYAEKTADGASRPVYRGGSWHDDPAYCRAASHSTHAPTLRFSYGGFRVVIAPNGSPPATLKNSVGMEFVKVPKGTAWLGGVSGQEGNTKVEIEQDFYLGKYEVTQEEWKAVMGLAPSHFSRNGAGADSVKDVSDEDLKKLPVEQVSWEDCQLFIERLNTKEKDTGRVYRLPNESEWEYACRGGPVDRLDSAFGFYFANPTNTLLPAQANFGFPQALKRTTKVGSYDPNVLGLHDMHGNVWEWCDYADKTAEVAPRLFRGGSWDGDAAYCRTKVRYTYPPSVRDNRVGFRVALIWSGVSDPAEQGQGK